MRLSAGIAIFMVSLLVSDAAEPSRPTKWEWASPAEVERISLAVDLADFPIPQGKISMALGLPKGPGLGGSSMPNGATYMIWALSDPKAERGYYALRVVYRLYRNDETLPKPEDLEITSAEVLYVERGGLQFVVDPQSSIKRMIPDLRKLMNKAKQSPGEFSKRWFDLKKEDEAYLKEQNEPNQPPLRMPVSGTPAADAPVAPPPGIAGR